MQPICQIRDSILGRGARALAAMILLAAAGALNGCAGAALGWFAQAVAPEQKVQEPTAEYLGLMNKSVAVLVSADDRTLFSFPDAPFRVSRYVTARLVRDIPGVRPVDPFQIAKFQREHPDWIVVPYGDLCRELNVERLVHVNLAQYTTQEVGNKELWQGVVRARVGVSEADGKDPSNFAYTTDISAMFPPDRPMGILNSDNETIQKGVLESFATKTVSRFRSTPQEK